jgi:hypothetical protein
MEFLAFAILVVVAFGGPIVWIIRELREVEEEAYSDWRGLNDELREQRFQLIDQRKQVKLLAIALKKLKESIDNDEDN